jgi:CRP-like cAMP-binding protein
MASDEHLIGPVVAGLSDAQIDLLRRHGQERATAQGEVLFREGDRGYDFLVILAGTVTAVDGYGGAERELAVGFPGDFVAELNLFTGERLYTTAVVREPGALLAVQVTEHRRRLSGRTAGPRMARQPAREPGCTLVTGLLRARNHARTALRRRASSPGRRYKKG